MTKDSLRYIMQASRVVTCERTFVNTNVNAIVIVQMDKSTRREILLFAVQCLELPETVSDTNGNDCFIPKNDYINEWTALPEKNEEGLFVLRFVYELSVPKNQPEQWVQMNFWEIESVEAQGRYVVVGVKSNKDHVNLLLDYLNHTFSHNYAQLHVSDEAKHFDLPGVFTKYALSQYWTARKLTALSMNISKFNSAIVEANKKKKSPRKPSSSGAGGSRSAPRPVPSASRLTEGPSRHSTPSKRTRDDMEKSGVTETAEVSSPPVMPTPLKKGENPDAVKVTRILREFNNYSKDCWPMGRHFTFNVDCFKCEPAPASWVVRSREHGGVKWQINNLMNNVKWDRQTVCVMPKGFKTRPTERDWPLIQNGEFYIIDGQHSLEASQIILKDDNFQHELKGDLRYWKAFLVWSDDWDKLRKISTYLNSGNKTKAFEASWAANIVAARDVWMAHGCPPKERENAKNQSPKWKVSLRTYVRKDCSFYIFSVHANFTNVRSYLVLY